MNVYDETIKVQFLFRSANMELLCECHKRILTIPNLEATRGKTWNVLVHEYGDVCPCIPGHVAASCKPFVVVPKICDFSAIFLMAGRELTLCGDEPRVEILDLAGKINSKAFDIFDDSNLHPNIRKSIERGDFVLYCQCHGTFPRDDAVLRSDPPQRQAGSRSRMGGENNGGANASRRFGDELHVVGPMSGDQKRRFSQYYNSLDESGRALVPYNSNLDGFNTVRNIESVTIDTTRSMFDKFAQSLVRIFRNEAAHASGFFIAAHAFVTCLHSLYVIDERNNRTFQTGVFSVHSGTSSRTFEERDLLYPTSHESKNTMLYDIAIVRVRNNVLVRTPLALLPADVPLNEEGLKDYTFGAKFLNTWQRSNSSLQAVMVGKSKDCSTVTDFAADDRLPDGISKIKALFRFELLYSAVTIDGDSGSPVVDQLGRLVAVHRYGGPTLADGKIGTGVRIDLFLRDRFSIGSKSNNMGQDALKRREFLALYRQIMSEDNDE